MRISSDPDDSHFHPHFAHCRIYLAGAERSNVITADEGGRFAVTYRLDEFGITVRDKKTGQALTDKFFGDVRIACSDWLRAAMEAPQDDDAGALGAAIYGIIANP
jgi:hypothetical protein